MHSEIQLAFDTWTVTTDRDLNLICFNFFELQGCALRKIAGSSKTTTYEVWGVLSFSSHQGTVA